MFINSVPLIIPLDKSKPPNTTINPNITTRCINNFFLFGNLTAKKANKNIIKPNIDGMYDVKEPVSLIKLTTKPQKIKNIP